MSHKHEDINSVRHLAQYFAYRRVPAYLDVMDPSIQGDDASLVNHIRDVIKDCSGLLAYATQIAQMSWWIPLEIAFGLETPIPVATYKVSPTVDLPSYLWEWSIVTNTDEAVVWAQQIRHTSADQLNAIWKASPRYEQRNLSASLNFA